MSDGVEPEETLVVSLHYRSIASTCLLCSAAPEVVRVSVAEDGQAYVAMMCTDHALWEAKHQTTGMVQAGSDFFRVRPNAN